MAKKRVKIKFDTSKEIFNDGFEVNIIKEKLYNQNSNSRIESEMNKFGINLSEKQITEEYEKCYQIEKIIELFCNKYEKELNELEKLNIMFDDDCIFLYINKIINQKYKIFELPDPNFIAETIEDFELVSDKNKYKACLNILNNIKNMYKYCGERNINILFEPTCIDINYEISNLIGIEMINLFLDFESTIEITNLVFEILNLYDFENPVDIYKDALTLISRHGYEYAKEKFEEGLRKYPNEKIALYNSVLIELNVEKEKDIYLKLYKEVNELPVISYSDRENIKIIKDNYEYDINENIYL